MTNLINQSKVRMPKSFVLEVDSFIRRRLKIPVKRELTIVFLDPTPAKKLNKTYRKKDYATDILSFEGATPQDLGELVICPQVLQKQAKEHDLSFKAELAYMLIHGVLHLLGYDHERSAKEAKKMFQIQDQLFDSLRNRFHI
jgi:probable rRNA maturation factor